VNEGIALARRLARVIDDERVLQAIAAVPRDRFVPADLRDRAWEDVALPIAGSQTISQPVVVARMLALLELQPTDRVLDVGTGSGYHAALLGRLAGEVHSIELQPELSADAARTLAELHCDNVTCVVADGWRGLPRQAPFDAINVAAATGRAPPPALVAQLAPGGRLIAPVGGDRQRLTLVRRTPEGVRRTRLEAVRFVPLVRA
jgi:protein-L-isoaspartate(D-aspartate) O-methyltransferase